MTATFELPIHVPYLILHISLSDYQLSAKSYLYIPFAVVPENSAVIDSNSSSWTPPTKPYLIDIVEEITLFPASPTYIKALRDGDQAP
jgi:hypothetical protein